MSKAATHEEKPHPARSGDAGAGGVERSGRHWNWRAMLTAAAVALAAFLLYRTLGRYSLDELVASVGEIPAGSLLACGGFAAASYLCLTGFDFMALRYVGHRLPYGKIAVASFCSLSLGHNIGLAAASAGAVRYRFYSRWGLSFEEVARVVLFCGLTVGVGLVTLAAAALLLRADLATRITGIPLPLVYAIGIACLAAVFGYLVLAHVWRKPLRIFRWSVEIPPLPLAIGQVVIGSANFACVAACLHQALAAVAEVDYFGVASVYVIANTLAMFSHVPGGLGVIEAVVLHLLPQADVIGPLLVFRFVYYLIPLMLGGPLFLLAEAVFRLRDRRSAAS